MDTYPRQSNQDQHHPILELFLKPLRRNLPWREVSEKDKDDGDLAAFLSPEEVGKVA